LLGNPAQPTAMIRLNILNGIVIRSTYVMLELEEQLHL
jgi:hypothetical protein